MKYEIAPPLAIHEIGLREKQEDCIFPQKELANTNDRLFILCDGMGGHLSGEIASQTVCQAISQYIYTHTDARQPFTDNMLATAMNAAYDALDGKDHAELEKKMGTTLVLLYFHAGGLMAAHIGDSRYYHIRPRENTIIYRSRDHSMATFRFETGELTLKQLATMQGKNIILRAMMPHQEEREMPDIVHIKDVRPGDWFFICSDGMLEKMSDDELLSVVCNKELSDEQKRDWMVTSTDGNKDNHSAYLIHVTGVMAEAIEESQPDDEAEARSCNKLFLAERNEAENKETDGYEAEESLTDRNASAPNSDYDTNGNSVVVVSPSRPNLPPNSPSYSKNKQNSYWMWIALAAILLAIAALAYIFLSPGKDVKPTPKVIYQEYHEKNKSENNESEYQQPRSHKGGQDNGKEPVSTPPNKPTVADKKVKRGGKTTDFKPGNSNEDNSKRSGGTHNENTKQGKEFGEDFSIDNAVNATRKNKSNSEEKSEQKQEPSRKDRGTREGQTPINFQTQEI